MDLTTDYISTTILVEPRMSSGYLTKGAIILSQCDAVLSIIPQINKYYYIIERHAWEGPNRSKYADIKLVEDLSAWNETKSINPTASLLDIGPADFVDTDNFKPLSLCKSYCGIQISSWNGFKRPFLFIDGAGMLPYLRFLKIGHFVSGGSDLEVELKRAVVEHMRHKNISNVHLPYSESINNYSLPNLKQEVNILINQCRLGILTTKVEGINRFKMECLAANIPVLVPSDSSFPTKKHINDDTGILYDPDPEGLKKAILFALNKYDSFSPREYVIRNSGIRNATEKLRQALIEKSGGGMDVRNIYWDGRNQSLIWGKEAIELLKNKIIAYETFGK